MTLLVFIHLLFLLSCSKPEKTPEVLFLENAMIREKGLYVLLGSKPMSSFYIEDAFSEAAEKSRYEKYLLEIHAKNSSPTNYEEFKKQHALPLRLHYRELWNKWNDKMQASISPCYRFISRKAPFGHESDFGLFINVPRTTYILKEHHESFSQITGISFDPFKILDEISDNCSLFWEKAFQSHYLMGLLFGFGEMNAFFFDWGAKHNFFPYSQEIDIDQQPSVWDKAHVSYFDLKLPLFGVYSINDSSLKNYRKERNYIMKQLKGKNFMKVVMEWLSGENSSQ